MANPGQMDNRPGMLLPLFLMICLLIVMWIVLHDSFARFLLGVADVVIWPLSVTVGHFQPDVFAQVKQAIHLATSTSAIKRVDFAAIRQVFSFAGDYYRWPLLVLMGWMAYDARRHPILNLNTKHSFESFLKYQSQVWKAIVPVLNLDLVNKNIPGWEPALRATEIVSNAGLIHGRELKIVETWKFLENQLGRRYRHGKLHPHEKALFAIFAARIARDFKASSNLLDQLNESTRGGKTPAFALANKLYDKYNSHPEVVKAVKGFGFVRTVLFQMLVTARRFDGKLPTSNFLWLKPMDRTLWYALDRAPVDASRVSVSSFPEGIAVVAQWQAERVALENDMVMSFVYQKVRMSFPCLVNAVTTLLIELESCGAIDFPENIVEKIRSSTNERFRYNEIRDSYVVHELASFLEERKKNLFNKGKERKPQ